MLFCRALFRQITAGLDLFSAVLLDLLVWAFCLAALIAFARISVTHPAMPYLVFHGWFVSVRPNKVFDYMAAGRPTVLAIKGPMSQAIQTSGAGICLEAENSSAIADAILLLRRSQEVRTEMGGKARAYVEQYFSRTEQARQFAQLLEDVAPVAPCKTQTSPTAGGSLLGSIRKR